MSPVRVFLSIWVSIGAATLALELSKWGNFWRKFDQMEKVPEARLIGGPWVFFISCAVIIAMWPIRIYYFTRRLIKWAFSDGRK